MRGRVLGRDAAVVDVAGDLVARPALRLAVAAVAKQRGVRSAIDARPRFPDHPGSGAIETPGEVKR
ncbi:MAG: hypothetical protein ACE5LF_04715 [Alphaproteobacteria bacterium]